MPHKAVHGGAGKRVPLNMKTTREVRAKLEAAADASGRSLTHEVEHQVELSLDWQLTNQTAHQQLGWVEDLVSQKGLAAIRQAGFDIVSTSDGERVLVDPKLLLDAATAIMDGRRANPPAQSIEQMIEAAVERGLKRVLGGRLAEPDPDARLAEINQAEQDENEWAGNARSNADDMPSAAGEAGQDCSVTGVRLVLAADDHARHLPAGEGTRTAIDPAPADAMADSIPQAPQSRTKPAARKQPSRKRSRAG
ncbi:MAG: hypothetical protein ABW003_07040 [Microvirga sp.]